MGHEKKQPSRRLARNLAWMILVVGGWGVVGAGCSGNPVLGAMESDANGYICAACGERFFTARNVFAECCPKCRQPNLVELVGYTCPGDDTLTIALRGAGPVACLQCRAALSGFKLPLAEEFKAWGAIERTPAEVLFQAP